MQNYHGPDLLHQDRFTLHIQRTDGIMATLDNKQQWTDRIMATLDNIQQQTDRIMATLDNIQQWTD